MSPESFTMIIPQALFIANIGKKIDCVVNGTHLNMKILTLYDFVSAGQKSASSRLHLSTSIEMVYE